jgi:hypothetical protein
MTQIIAGHFQLQEQAQQAVHQLIDAGFSEEKICSFYLNPPGQHDLYSIGGDRDKSPGAKESGDTMKRGAATGGVIGGAAGAVGVVAVGPIAPAVGALVGAHVGSLVGSLSGMKESGEAEQGEQGIERAAPVRESGMIVAVSTEQAPVEENAVNILRSLGANQIERAEGTIANGNWEDFDPLTTPTLIN